MASKVNVELYGDEPGVFAGVKSDPVKGGKVPNWSKGSQKVKSPPDFHASRESEATSNKAAAKPTYWRRGGFVGAGKRGR